VPIALLVLPVAAFVIMIGWCVAALLFDYRAERRPSGRDPKGARTP
jgi:hypothetical protein